MPPADQSLHAGGTHVGKVESRLVGQEELPALERRAEIHLELHALLDHVLHSGLVHRVAVATVPLRAVHRDVGVPQQAPRARPIAGRDADAGADRHGRLALGSELERLLERVQQAFGDQRGTGVRGEVADEDDELVAPQPPERVHLAYDAVEPCRDGLEELVADLMAKRVVDRLEVVEVDEEGRDVGLVARRARQHLLDAVDDQRPVGKVGERIVRRHERELLFA